MALLETPLCDYGKKIINFDLINIDDKFISLNHVLGKNGTLIMFICNHCPYVKAVIEKIVYTSKKLKKYDVNSIAIMPNDIVNYPEDDFENMKKFSMKFDFDFPYLLDQTQEVSRLYGAVCTPDFFGYNKFGELQYRGRIAEMKNLQFQNDTNELLNAMIEIAETSKGPKKQFASAGCSIKWK
tara:strand:+ start:628 stop:1176 length:549 start_codon:yes stop_codon:yes gene_type:complete